MNRLLAILIAFFPLAALAQAVDSKNVSFVYKVMGTKGVLIVIGIMFFAFSYMNSVKLFAWIEDQTYGTRDFILQRCELLFYEIKPERVTYILLFLSLGISTVVTSICFIFGKYTLGVILGIMLSVIGWKIPRPIMNYLVSKRVKVYETQMVDALGLLSNGLRAGLSVPQSIGMVVEELPAPVSQEFNLILQQTKIGVPLDEAFNDLARRVPTLDNDMFVSSVNILRETGGNLAEVFDTIANVVRERVRLQQKIDTFIAQGKLQGGLIFCMPFLMALYFGSSDPEFFNTLLGTPIGIIVTIVAMILNLTGGFFMWKVIQIKV